ncbi:XdhC family protein [Zhihengliuella alba]|uniref:XdhC family protein n=1 Tax=Zhihengliuella alba TaxID=547018 RepID=A0ABP7DKI1_9MICC
MLDLMPLLGDWPPTLGGRRCAVATIVSASGSVPRPPGTSMLVSEDGDVLGSLSGGCIEGAVVEAALEVLHDGVSRLERFGYSADDAFAAGLTCGGELEVHLGPAGPRELAELLAIEFGAAGLVPAAPQAGSRTGRGPGSRIGAPTGSRRGGGAGARAAAGDAGTTAAPLALVRRLDGPGGAVVVHDPAGFRTSRAAELSRLLGGTQRLGRTQLLGGTQGLLASVAAQLGPLLRGGVTGRVELAVPGECESGPVSFFVESRLPAPRLLVFGANDFGAALIPVGRMLGYEVTLCDARPAFAGQARFRAADHVAAEWPHRYLAEEAAAGRIDARTAVCVLGHDPKFDVPLLRTALDLDLAYVGAMGSRRSHGQRIDALLSAGTAPERLLRLHSPIGLDLGAVTPAEVAVSIAAEIIAVRVDAPATSLKEGAGPIHADHRPGPSRSPLVTAAARTENAPGAALADAAPHPTSVTGADRETSPWT